MWSSRDRVNEEKMNIIGQLMVGDGGREEKVNIELARSHNATALMAHVFDKLNISKRLTTERRSIRLHRHSKLYRPRVSVISRLSKASDDFEETIFVVKPVTAPAAVLKLFQKVGDA
ncbi:5240_t:CDS:2 [Paraglomus occultum]|uniref:5240_t:CDS:1 n=1 Tax=Paraglomus occultum TaxID=144539 RepID=A0A9N9GLW1_9GLOM|nr:5240_t:CDS:2 [Paraglomus occultum]